MEEGLEEEYARRFGNLQYLSRLCQGEGALSYEEKLRRYLQQVLATKEETAKVRNAFDACVFLSYRKKDRRQARALRRSAAFVLLVTPRLTEEENYVARVEYPAARQEGKTVLPVQVEQTEWTALRRLFVGLPACVDPESGEDLERALLSVLGTALHSDRAAADPERLFLRGLAYLRGLDTEVDRAAGLALLLRAAEGESLAAMEQLCRMYRTGEGVAPDMGQALFWAERQTAFCRRAYGETAERTVLARANLADLYMDAGKADAAATEYRALYAHFCRTEGAREPGCAAYPAQAGLCLQPSRTVCRGQTAAGTGLRLDRAVLWAGARSDAGFFA